MATPPKRNFQDSIKEHIRRAIANREIKGTEKLKWCLAGIKLLQLEKMTGSNEHGAGFADIDEEPDEELTEPEEEGATDGTRTDGHPGGAAA